MAARCTITQRLRSGLMTLDRKKQYPLVKAIEDAIVVIDRMRTKNKQGVSRWRKKRKETTT